MKKIYQSPRTLAVDCPMEDVILAGSIEKDSGNKINGYTGGSYTTTGGGTVHDASKKRSTSEYTLW